MEDNYFINPRENNPILGILLLKERKGSFFVAKSTMYKAIRGLRFCWGKESAHRLNIQIRTERKTCLLPLAIHFYIG